MNKRGDVYDVIKMCCVGAMQKEHLCLIGSWVIGHLKALEKKNKSSLHNKHNFVKTFTDLLDENSQ